MIGQRALIALAVAAGALAGILYYVGAQRSPVVVAARDIDATHPLTSEDLTTVSIPHYAMGREDFCFGGEDRSRLVRVAPCRNGSGSITPHRARTRRM